MHKSMILYADDNKNNVLNFIPARAFAVISAIIYYILVYIILLFWAARADRRWCVTIGADAFQHIIIDFQNWFTPEIHI